MDSNGGRENGTGSGSHRLLNQEELTAVFRRLGARDPEGWARSQIVEGINQLARFLFLRQAWGLVVDESDAGWIERHIKRAEAKPREPYAGVGLALKALRARGAEGDEILDLVRGVQAELLFNLCYLLDEGGDLEAEAFGVEWGLVEIDQEGRPREHIGGLHESVLDTDPTGREMRTRKSVGP